MKNKNHCRKCVHFDDAKNKFGDCAIYDLYMFKYGDYTTCEDFVNKDTEENEQQHFTNSQLRASTEAEKSRF